MKNVGVDAILRSIDLVLSTRKIGLAFLGIVATVLGAGIFIFLATAVGVDQGVIALIFTLLGALAAWAITALFSGAITYMSWQDLTTGREPRPMEALSYSSRHLLGFLLSPLAILLTAVAIMIVEVLVLFLGRIPYLGELFASLLFLPLVLVNLLLLVAIFAGSWLVYPIIAATGAGIGTTIRTVVDLVRRSPGRLAAYFILAMVIIGFVVGLTVPLVFLARTWTMTVLRAGVGDEKLSMIAASNLWGALASPEMAVVGLLDSFNPLNALSGGSILGGFGSFSADFPFTIELAGFLLGAGTLVLMGTLLFIFPWVFSLTVSCAVYASLEPDAPSPVRAAAPPAPKPALAPEVPAPGPAYTPPEAPYQYEPPQPSPGYYEPPPAAPAYEPPSPAPAYEPPSPAAYEPPPAEPEDNRCVHCEKEIKPNSRFCPYCGTPQP